MNRSAIYLSSKQVSHLTCELEQRKFNITSVHDVSEALKLISHHNIYAAVIIDAQDQPFLALSFLKQAKRLCFMGAKIVIINEEDHDFIDNLYALGANDIIHDQYHETNAARIERLCHTFYNEAA